MLIDFFLNLKKSGIKTSLKELLDLINALNKGVIKPSMEDFYYLSRSIMDKDEKYFDRFDRAFSIFFELREVPGLKKNPSTSELIDWIKLLLSDDIPRDVLLERDETKAIPPLHGALIKNEQDVHLLERLRFMMRRGR